MDSPVPALPAFVPKLSAPNCKDEGGGLKDELPPALRLCPVDPAEFPFPPANFCHVGQWGRRNAANLNNRTTASLAETRHQTLAPANRENWVQRHAAAGSGGSGTLPQLIPDNYQAILLMYSAECKSICDFMAFCAFIMGHGGLAEFFRRFCRYGGGVSPATWRGMPPPPYFAVVVCAIRNSKPRIILAKNARPGILPSPPAFILLS